MKLRVMSDLHIEFLDFRPPEEPADVVVLAGDILNEHYGLIWARKSFPDTAIVYVMGNHEFYNAHYERVLERARKEAQELGIQLLENDQAVVYGVRFLGMTLWTDFTVEEPVHTVDFSMWHANRQMADFSLIRYRGGRLSAEATREFHRTSRRWLSERLAESFEGKTVVVSHHLPHKASIARQFHLNPLNPAFASHMPELVCPPVSVWIHGHTHCSCDYEPVEGTRVVCNPRGYGPSELNTQFDPCLVVEI